MNWCRKAAEQGDARAQNNLGWCYDNGLGVLQDYTEAVNWYRKAAERGHARAQANLAWCYENGLGVSQDYPEAVKWFRKAAEQGIADAQNSLGACYSEGNGVAQDYDKAVKWFRKAAEQGNAHAQQNLGVHYAHGLGVSRDYAEAVKWYRKAAERETAIAQNDVGVFQENGQGVSQTRACPRRRGETMTFKELLDRKAPRVRRACWTPPIAYLKLIWLQGGEPWPMAILYSVEEQKAIDEATAQLVGIPKIDADETDWEEYLGPLCPEQDPCIIPEHERSIARISANASGEEYCPLPSLTEAQQAPDGRVIMEGDWGGQVYLTCPANTVKCCQEVLHRLLLDIDARCWACNEGEGAGVYFERKPVGAGVGGGMGGGTVTDGLWLHEEVEGFGIRAQIEEILGGHRERLESSAEPGAAADDAGMSMVLIPAGEFMMGSPDSDKQAQGYEKPQHRVRITRPFWLGMHLVTVGQFRKFVEESQHDAGTEWQKAFPSQTDDHPVVNVSWDDAQAFCDWLSRKEGERYRLPTEAEWEYACRAGTLTTWSFGDDEADLGDHAWFDVNANEQPHAVGQKRPNSWGLFDMHGNVFEWCQDWDGDYYAKSPPDDPTGPATGSGRVIRGGSWAGSAGWCRSACRGLSEPTHSYIEPGDRYLNLGFRVSRDIADK